jgi:hypothetical protein
MSTTSASSRKRGQLPGHLNGRASALVNAPSKPGDEQNGGWTHGQLVMDARFCAAMERAISRGLERRPDGEAPERAASGVVPAGTSSVVLSWPMARRPKPDRRRALELLAASHDGATEAIMRAHGVTVPQMVQLVRTGLATAHAGRVVAGGRTVEIALVRITKAGRRMLAEQRT